MAQKERINYRVKMIGELVAKDLLGCEKAVRRKSYLTDSPPLVGLHVLLRGIVLRELEQQDRNVQAPSQSCLSMA